MYQMQSMDSYIRGQAGDILKQNYVCSEERTVMHHSVPTQTEGGEVNRPTQHERAAGAGRLT